MEWTFEWDEEKAKENVRKHHVRDPEHSGEEDRFIDLGCSVSGQILVVVYTERGGNIRLISSRQATPSERRRYEEGYF